MRPISLEVISRVLTTFQHCASCAPAFRVTGVEDAVNREALAEYPEDLQEEFRRLSELIGRLRSLYLHRVRIDLISAQSFLGMYKAVRHHIKEYPAFIVDGKDVCIGWDWEKLVNAIDRHIGDNN